MAHFWCHLHHDAQEAGQAGTSGGDLEFFSWAYDKGDQMASELDYVPLPDAVVKMVRKEWEEIRDAGGQSSIAITFFASLGTVVGTAAARAQATWISGDVKGGARSGSRPSSCIWHAKRAAAAASPAAAAPCTALQERHRFAALVQSKPSNHGVQRTGQGANILDHSRTKLSNKRSINGSSMQLQ